MVEPLKKLTVSYGAFSCTLEGFDDPFPVMKQVVDYFQNLADRDPGFGAHPERPDADYLRSLAQRSVGGEEVEAEVHDGGVILRQTGDAAEAFAGMEVVEETVVVTPSAFQPSTVEDDTGDAEEIAAEAENDSLLVEVAESEEFDDIAEQPEMADEPEFETPDLVEASEVADLIDADPLLEMADDDQPQIDELAALHADMERFDTEPVVDTTPVAAELPDILKPDWEPTEAIAPMFEDFPGVSDEDLAASEREVTEMALDTGDTADIKTMYIEGEPETEDSSVEIDAAEDEPETAEEMEKVEELEAVEETAEEPKTKSGLVSRLPNWAAGLIRPSAGSDLDDDLDVVDFGTDKDQADLAETDMNGATTAEDLDPEDAALERLLKVTQSRREEPESSDTDALSEIREGILSMTPTPNPEWNGDEDTASETSDAEDTSEADDALETAEASYEEEDVAVASDDAEETAEVSETEEAEETLAAFPEIDTEIETSEAADEIIAEDDTTVDEDDLAETEDEIEAASVFDAETEIDASEPDAPSITLEKPMKVLEPLQLTTAFKVSDESAEEVAQEETASDETASEETATEEPADEIAATETAASEETEDTAQDRSAFRLVHNRKEEAEETTEMSDAPTAADDDLSLAIFASKVGAASLPELLEASAAYTTIVAGQTRFSRRSIMGMLDEMGTERKYSQEARIKSFGKLIRSGTILRVEDGQFAISRSAKFNYEMKIGA